MTDRERKTVRYGAIGLGIYLVVYFGGGCFQQLGGARRSYQLLASEAQSLKERFSPYETRVLLLEKLRDKYQMNPRDLDARTLAGEASAAIQEAAQSSGIKLGPVRETSGRASAKELASIRVEGTGQPENMLKLLHQIPLLGFPLIMDSVELSVDPKKRGEVKLTLSLVILDFEGFRESESEGRRV